MKLHKINQQREKSWKEATRVRDALIHTLMNYIKTLNIRTLEAINNINTEDLEQTHAVAVHASPVSVS